MIIDENTKIIGRFHTKSSGRGLNIYNPFFEESNLNALYILFYNEDPKTLINGFRSFNLHGAITAGFESNEELPKLLDDVEDRAKFIGKIGYITNNAGKLVGKAQGGQGMFSTVAQVTDFDNKRISIVGAGNIAKGLLYEINQNHLTPEVRLFNRDVRKAELLKEKFSFVNKVGTLNAISESDGDVLINLTDLGGSETDNLFTEEIISKFGSVVDVTFEKEDTNLINIAKKLNKKYATGWDMFTNQGLVILEDLFKQKFEFNLLKKYVIKGLSKVVQ